jgi:hypothetical protein
MWPLDGRFRVLAQTKCRRQCWCWDDARVAAYLTVVPVELVDSFRNVSIRLWSFGDLSPLLPRRTQGASLSKAGCTTGWRKLPQYAVTRRGRDSWQCKCPRPHSLCAWSSP